MDTYDAGIADHTSLPPLTRAIFDAYPKTMGGNTIGPTASDKALRATLDAIRSLEDRVTALGG
ncbi:hypothetical protein A5791_19835 [Mycobacterium sp. 852002-51163_SCH5372311]|uniref:hypothetical protein n=1 Tax=Mycobacterium sp. 852002-51163_SCH5372311 TaxID=1834097 RepID=UPI0007FBDAF2|nr:hypothetical protein [Mycobacterium sp. 852002-51163_SCH5372311]OBF86949.1 hypothetical protein A5791_19835 [Mycobacterium sp. 852002-51163_SCH5372311]